MALTGTPAQADLVVKLHAKLRTIKNPADVQKIRQTVLAADQREVRMLIAALNEKLGFEPQVSAATDKQLVFIGDLERKLYGVSETRRADGLTYAEADARIKLLLELKGGNTHRARKR
jgi:hypothetical protein